MTHVPSRGRPRAALAALLIAIASRAQPQGAAQTVTLVGRVVSSIDTSAVANATLEVVGVGREVRSDSRGRFRFAGLPKSTVRIQLRRIGFAPMLIEVYLADDANDLVIAMEPTGRLLDVIRTQAEQTGVFGTVTDYAGRVLPGSEVQGVVHRTGVILTNADGQFSLEDVRPGPELVTVVKSGYKPRLVSFTMPPSGGMKLEITMQLLRANTEARGVRANANAMWAEMFDIGQRMRWQAHSAGAVARDELDQYGRGLPLDIALNRVPSMSRRSIRTGSVGCIFVDGIYQNGAELKDFNADEVEMVQIVPPGGDFLSGSGTNDSRTSFCAGDAFVSASSPPPEVPPILTKDPNTGKPMAPNPTQKPPAGVQTASPLNPTRVIAYIWLRH